MLRQVFKTITERQWKVLAVAGVLLAGVVAYSSLPDNGFVAWDDDKFILEDPVVSAPLSVETVLSAFSFREGVYWQPLAILSLAATKAIFGPDPAAFHIESLFWHLACAIVLLFVIAETTGRLGRATMVAMLFAVHPLNVESVAWAVERRTVLSVFFAMVAVAAYVRWTRRPKAGTYAMLLVFASLALLSKALVVILPALLLALDVWPLRGMRPDTVSKTPSLLWEKLLIIVLSAVTVFLVHQSLATFSPGPVRSFTLRSATALCAIARQLLHVVAPVNLAPFYSYPDKIEAGALITATLVVFGITIIGLRLWNRYPYLLAGWMWFVAGLIPTLGFRQAGTWPALADRHAYLAVIGVFWAVVWGTSDLAAWWIRSRRFRHVVLSVLAAAALSILVVMTNRQVGVWRDSVTLFSRAVEESPRSPHIRYNLGTALVSVTPPREQDALPHFLEAARLDPLHHQTRTNLGLVLAALGREEEALQHLYEATRLAPADALAHAGLGDVLLQAGRNDEAAIMLSRAVALDPNNSGAWANLGNALNLTGKYQETIRRLEAGSSAARARPEGRLAIGVAYAATGDREAALREVEALRRTAPPLAEALERYLRER